MQRVNSLPNEDIRSLTPRYFFFYYYTNTSLIDVNYSFIRFLPFYDNKTAQTREITKACVVWFGCPSLMPKYVFFGSFSTTSICFIRFYDHKIMQKKQIHCQTKTFVVFWCPGIFLFSFNSFFTTMLVDVICSFIRFLPFYDKEMAEMREIVAKRRHQ